MKTRRNLFIGFIALVGLFILIIDAKTAMVGAKNGIEICMKSVFPSVFPFLILSQLISGEFFGRKIKLLSPVRKLCSIPDGAESIFLLGLLSGYPVGAQSIAQARKNGSLNKNNAHRLLGFCSNAGPAFIFGMGLQLFDSVKPLWILWIIHIFSAILVGYTLPNKEDSRCNYLNRTQVNISKIMQHCVKTIALVCGWVITFRIIIAFLDHWFLWMVPQEINVAIVGLLELANGCNSLKYISDEALRFVLFSVFLGFGGICVGLQTISVTQEVGTGMYFPGKCLQGIYSFTVSSLMQFFVFRQPSVKLFNISVGMILIITTIYLIEHLNPRKKVVAIRK